MSNNKNSLRHLKQKIHNPIFLYEYNLKDIA